MRWIGGQNHQLGELGDEARVRSIFMASANVANNARGLRGQPGDGGRRNNEGRENETF